MRKNHVPDYMKGELIQSHPAYDIYAAKPHLHYGTKLTVPIFSAGDEIGLPFETAKYGTMYKFFQFGSVVSFALENYSEPLNAYQQAVERGHKTHWLITLATSISNPPPPKVDKLACNWGDIVMFEGRAFSIKKTSNGNAELVTVE